MSRTNAHSRRQVGSLVPVLRGISRRAARGGVGWTFVGLAGDLADDLADDLAGDLFSYLMSELQLPYVIGVAPSCLKCSSHMFLGVAPICF